MNISTKVFCKPELYNKLFLTVSSTLFRPRISMTTKSGHEQVYSMSERRYVYDNQYKTRTIQW